MIFVPRKKLIRLLSRQRGNIVSFRDPTPQPPIPPNEDATEYLLDELAGNPGGAGAFRFDMQWRPDGLRVFTCRAGFQMSQNDVSPAWGIQAGNWTNIVNTANFNNLRSIWWNADGTRLSRCVRIPSFNSNITVYDQSATPYDLAVLGSSVTLNFPVFPALSGGPGDHVWSADGLLFWLHYFGAPNQLYEFSVTVPFDITTLVTPQNKEFDWGADENFTIRTFEFSNDGTKLFAMDGAFLVSWDLPTPFDIGTATNFQTGPAAPTSLGIPRGLAARSDNEDLSVEGDQNLQQVAWFRVPPPVPPQPPPVNLWEDKDFQVNPEQISGGIRIDVLWKADGTRAWTVRDSSNRCDQHDVSPPFSIAPGTWTNRIQDTTNFGDPRCIWVRPDGTLLIRQTGGGLLNAFTMSPAFSIAGLSAATGIFNGTGKLDMYWSADGLTVWFYSSSNPTNSISEHALTVAWDMSTFQFTATRVKDLTPDGITLHSFTFSDDGFRLYGIIPTGSPGSIIQYELAVAFNIATAGPLVVGIEVGDPTRMSIPRGLNYRAPTIETDGILWVFGDQGVGNQRVKLYGPAPPLGPGVTIGAGVAYGQVAVNGDMDFTLPVHNDGDLLLLTHYIGRTDNVNNFVLVTTPGWVEVSAALKPATGSAMTQRMWTKFGNGVETIVTVNNQYAGGAGFSLACVPCAGVRSVEPAIFDVTPSTSHAKLQNNSSNPTAVALTTIQDAAAVVLFCGHTRTFATYAPPTGYDDNANNSFNTATIYACSKIVSPAGLETPGPWNTTGVNAGADPLMMTVALKT